MCMFLCVCVCVFVCVCVCDYVCMTVCVRLRACVSRNDITDSCIGACKL